VTVEQNNYMKLRKVTVWVMVSIVTFSLGVVAVVLRRIPAKGERNPTQALTRDIPKASWEPIFFRQINTVARLSGQSELRKTALKPGEHEARIWGGFGLSPLRGMTLRYVDGQWSAIYVEADNYWEPTKVTRFELKPPQSGWESFWKQLVDAGILKLPDASAIGCGESGGDGFGVVVETNVDNIYRTYMYPNPTPEQCAEARSIVKITDLTLIKSAPDLPASK
jgi:hypothetical protein